MDSPTASSSSTVLPQYAFRAQKSLALIDAHPNYTPSPAAEGLLSQEASTAKIFRYSPSGKQFGYIVGTTVTILNLSTKTSRTLPTSTPIIDLSFSPLGSYLFTYERQVKQEDGVAGHRNLRVWWLGREERRGGKSGSVGDGEVEDVREVAGWGQKGYEGWIPQVTDNESHLLRLSTTTEISIFTLAPPTSLSPLPPPTSSPTSTSDLTTLSQSIGLHSPSSKIRDPSGSTIRSITLGPAKRLGTGARDIDPLAGGLAVWLGEYKGAPASVNLFTLRGLIEAAAGGTGNLPQTGARKNFFKGDKVVLKWNKAGTMALFLTQSDVDSSGKSYYGETNLYLIGLSGQFECKVALDKEGPIHDYAWNPNSREFSVCYGYMPARTVLFDLKANPTHAFEPKPRNFISYQPQGRLFLNAGFGNLTGTIDVWDLKTRKKVAEFQAPNSTTCEWSPDGLYILTGTLSPRLRVDNGVKVWWCGGKLLYVQSIEELYQTAWRPGFLESFPPFPATIPEAPAPHPSVAENAPTKTSDTPTKPVGAYRPPGARGTATPSIFKREDEGGAASLPSANGSGSTYVPGTWTPKTRHIPGAPPGAAKTNGGEEKAGKGKKGKKNANGNASGAASPAAPATPAPEPASPAVNEADSEAAQKKIRNLNKKLKAIVDLKERRTKGETLEATQIKKIEGEAAILDELKALEISAK